MSHQADDTDEFGPVTAETNEWILPDGTRVHGGNIPGVPRLAFTLYGTVPNQPKIPRDEWKDRIDEMGTGPELWNVEDRYGYIHDQNGYGMCNASATASAMESQRAKQGLPFVRLSAGDLYRRICFRGQDSGSTLEDGIAAAMAVGVASVDVVPYLDWRGANTGEKESQAKYRVEKAFLAPDYEMAMSGVLSGYDLISGIWWYNSYTNVGSDGWLPKASGSRGGHAVHGYKPTYRTSGSSIEYGIWHKNSWRESFGLKGRCVFPERVYTSNGIGGWWLVRSVVDEGGVITAA